MSAARIAPFPREAKPWTSRDVARLMLLAAEQRYDADIARALGRSVHSVRGKRRELGCLRRVGRPAARLAEPERWIAIPWLIERLRTAEGSSLAGSRYGRVL